MGGKVKQTELSDVVTIQVLRELLNILKTFGIENRRKCNKNVNDFAYCSIFFLFYGGVPRRLYFPALQ
jgi:hypothetical protein